MKISCAEMNNWYEGICPSFLHQDRCADTKQHSDEGFLHFFDFIFRSWSGIITGHTIGYVCVFALCMRACVGAIIVHVLFQYG